MRSRATNPANSAVILLRKNCVVQSAVQGLCAKQGTANLRQNGVRLSRHDFVHYEGVLSGGPVPDIADPLEFQVNLSGEICGKQTPQIGFGFSRVAGAG